MMFGRFSAMALCTVAMCATAFSGTDGRPRPFSAGPEVFDPCGGHIQGIAATEEALYVAQMTQIVKLDWSGRLLAKRKALSHTGDIAWHDGELYAAVAVYPERREGRIQVYDGDLNLVRETSVDRTVDGIACVGGVLYVGMGAKEQPSKKPHRVNIIGRFDAKTLQEIAPRAMFDYGHETRYGFQNIVADGDCLYASFYAVEGAPKTALFDTSLKLRGTRMAGANQGFDILPASMRAPGARFVRATTNRGKTPPSVSCGFDFFDFESAPAAPGAGFEGWTPKFYPGLEADGKVVFSGSGFCGGPSVDLVWTVGMPKFGIAKRVETGLKGVVDWTVSAYMKCAETGRAAAAMEFFDAKGRSLGVVTGARRSFAEWTRAGWKFTSPRNAAAAELHLLSLAEAPVSFARVEVSSVQGIDKNDVPFDMTVIPAEWNRDWNGGRTRMTSFSDAPLPMTVLLTGDRKALKAPAFEIDLPDGLEIKDAFCPFALAYGRETPVSATPFETNGVRMTRLRFERLRYLKFLSNASSADNGKGITLVVGPRKGGEKLEKTFRVVCRTLDGSRLAAEREIEMAFRPLPEGLATTRRFMAMGWNSTDRRFTDTAAFMAALRAYEAAGIRMFRLNMGGTQGDSRMRELRAILEARPVPYVFAAALGDLWLPRKAALSKKELAAMGGRFSVTSDKEGRRADKMCPHFFTTNETFRRHLAEKAIRPKLAKNDIRDGDWVTMDMEPWQSYTYCYCADCLKAFAAFAKLDHVPDMAEASAMRDEWAEFRTRQSAKTVEIVAEIVRGFNPTLKVVDYDYILEYGNPESRATFIRRCAKDTLMNERWLDGHLCSYYHCIGRKSFEAMKNNVRNLKKPYYPMAGLSGCASWMRPDEVRNPRQIRQFGLAAFVNGCPGYAFYHGVGFDGEVLLAMMQVQDAAARYEDLPWGKVDGRTAVEGPADRIAYASTVRPDGSEVVAVFNYDETDAAEVKVGGETHTIPPLGVTFIDVGS